MCGSGGTSLGVWGLFSTFSPVWLSFFFRSLSLALTPPPVPVVPSLGSGRFLSSMTPSLDSGIFLPSTIVGSWGRSLRDGNLSGSAPLPVISTKGPACGLPSLPSTGASLVPYFLLLLAASEIGSPYVLDLATPSLASLDTAAAVAIAGRRRRRRARLRDRSFMLTEEVGSRWKQVAWSCVDHSVSRCVVDCRQGGEWRAIGITMPSQDGTTLTGLSTDGRCRCDYRVSDFVLPLPHT